MDHATVSVTSGSTRYSISTFVEGHDVSGSAVEGDKSVKAEEESLDFEDDELESVEVSRWASEPLLFLNTTLELTPRAEDTPDIQADRALILLDIALVRGNIREDQHNHFRDKFNLLLKAHKRSRNRVGDLLEQIHKARETIKEQRSLEETFGSLPETTTNVKGNIMNHRQASELGVNATELRMQILTFKNKLETSDGRMVMMNNILQSLKEKRNVLQAEHDNYKKSKHINRETFENLKYEIHDLDVEVLSTKHQLGEMQNKAGKLERSIKLEEQKLAVKLEIVAALEDDIAEAKLIKQAHEHFIEQAGLKIQAKQEALKRMTQQRDELHRALDMTAVQVKTYVGQRKALEGVYKQEEAKLQRRLRQLEDTKRKACDVNAQQAETRKSAAQLAQQLTLSDVLRSQVVERRQTALRDKERQLAVMKSAQLRCDQAREQLETLSARYRSLGSQLELVLAQNQKLEGDQKKLQTELEQLYLVLLRRNVLSARETGAHASLTHRVAFLRDETSAAREHVRGLCGQLSRAAFENTRAAEVRAKLRCRLRQLVAEGVRLESRRAADAKTLARQEARAEGLERAVDGERHECSRDHQQALLEGQKVIEWRERLKIINTEVGNLWQLYGQRVRQLEKTRACVQTEQAVRDALHVEKLSLQDELQQLLIEMEAAEMLLRRGRRAVVRCRRAGMMASDEFDACVNERNICALRLRDRTEEAAIFVEKVKTFKDMLNRADCENQQRLEVVCRLRTLRDCELKDAQLLRQRVHCRGELTVTVLGLSQQLCVVTTKEVTLEGVFESGTRHRVIGDVPEVPDPLREKYLSLERRLRTKEQRLVELQLLQGQISRITTALQRDLSRWSEDGQRTTCFRVHIQKQVDVTNRQIKALTSEVALVKANAHCLREQMETQQAELKTAMRCMERGEVPANNIAKEWNEMERRRKLVLKTSYPEIVQPMPSPRPTAYIPTVEGRMTLGLPRPYGAQPPFKPFRPTPHLRHYHTPVKKTGANKTDIEQAIKKESDTQQI